MKIRWDFEDKITENFTFNDETGKYEKAIDQFKITINSWNKKVEITETNGCVSYLLPAELIKVILELDKSCSIEIEKKEDDENGHNK